MKRKIFALAVIVCYISLLAWHTFAFYTYQGTAHNIITSGGVKIAVEEWQQTEDGLVEYPNEPISIMPGAEISKIVTVKGLDASAWIRVKYDYTILSASGEDITDSRDVLDELILIEPDTESWIYRDGWWYYKSAIDKNEITEPLFSKVGFSADKLGNKYEGSTLTITVTASAVQTANNGTDVLDADGWAE